MRACGGAGGRRPDWWAVCGLRGLWLRCRWSWSPDWRVARGLLGNVAAVPVGGGPTGGWCVVCGDCGCGAGGRRPDWWVARGLQGLAGLRGDAPSEARWDGGCGAGGHGRPTGGWCEACRAWPGFEATRRAMLAAWTASGRAGLAPHGGLAGCVARRSGGVGRVDGERAGRPRAARRSDGCAIMLPRPAIARARTPVLSPAACTTLESSS